MLMTTPSKQSPAQKYSSSRGRLALQGKTGGEGARRKALPSGAAARCALFKGMASRGLRVATHCLDGFGAPISPKLHKGRSRRIQQTRPPGMARWVRAPFVPSGRPEQEMERKGCRARQAASRPVRAAAGLLPRRSSRANSRRLAQPLSLAARPRNSAGALLVLQPRLDPGALPKTSAAPPPAPPPPAPRPSALLGLGVERAERKRARMAFAGSCAGWLMLRGRNNRITDWEGTWEVF